MEINLAVEGLMQAVKSQGFVLLTVLIISGLLASMVLEQAHELMLAKRLDQPICCHSNKSDKKMTQIHSLK